MVVVLSNDTLEAPLSLFFVTCSEELDYATIRGIGVDDVIHATPLLVQGMRERPSDKPSLRRWRRLDNFAKYELDVLLYERR